MRFAAAAALGALVVVPARADQPPSGGDRYAVGAVKADFKARQRIGARRAGLVCLPAGSFKWSDARAGLVDAKAALAAALHGEIPDAVDTADDPFSDESRFRIVAKLDAFTLNACVRKWGMAAKLAHNHGLTGRGHVTITWSIFDRTSRSSIGQDTIDTDFDIAPDVDDAAEALLAGLKANATQFAQQRWPATRAR